MDEFRHVWKAFLQELTAFSISSLVVSGTCPITSFVAFKHVK
jgi:hypothetical protein